MTQQYADLQLLSIPRGTVISGLLLQLLLRLWKRNVESNSGHDGTRLTAASAHCQSWIYIASPGPQSITWSHQKVITSPVKGMECWQHDKQPAWTKVSSSWQPFRRARLWDFAAPIFQEIACIATLSSETGWTVPVCFRRGNHPRSGYVVLRSSLNENLVRGTVGFKFWNKCQTWRAPCEWIGVCKWLSNITETPRKLSPSSYMATEESMVKQQVYDGSANRPPKMPATTILIQKMKQGQPLAMHAQQNTT